MYLTFKSLDSFGNEIKYETEYKRIENGYIFDDLSVENTTTTLYIKDGNITIERNGDTLSKFNFIINNKTPGFYKNNAGLEINLDIFTKKINLLADKLYLEYDLIVEDDVISSHKIWILFH